MKNVFKLLLLAPLAFSSTGCNEKSNKINVVVISGQSNAVGCTFSECLTSCRDSNKISEYTKGYDNIKISFDSWTKDVNPLNYYSQNHSYAYEFVKVQLGQGNSKNTFGPEIGIAESMHKKYGNKLYIIKFACGASNLKDDWTHRNSLMYSRMIDYVREQVQNLKNLGYEPTIKAFCWMQGEGDSYDGYYQSYYENLKEFVGNLRTDLLDLSGDKEVPFIDAGISDAEPWVYYDEVNIAKKQFANESENNFYIDTISAGLHTNQEPFNNIDVCHYDSDSQLKLGYLFSQTFEQFLD